MLAGFLNHQQFFMGIFAFLQVGPSQIATFFKGSTGIWHHFPTISYQFWNLGAAKFDLHNRTAIFATQHWSELVGVSRNTQVFHTLWTHQIGPSGSDEKGYKTQHTHRSLETQQHSSKKIWFPHVFFPSTWICTRWKKVPNIFSKWWFTGHLPW